MGGGRRGKDGGLGNGFIAVMVVTVWDVVVVMVVLFDRRGSRAEGG